MKTDVDYDKLVEKVLGDCVPDADKTFDALYQDADQRDVLDGHARRYMKARDEKELYSPFLDFAEALFHFAELPFRFIAAHANSIPNDRPENGNPHRKSVTLCAFRKHH